MKKPFLRVLISAIVLALICGVIVVITGLLRGWKTSTQFSDGFFWAGAILISIGLLNFMGGFSQRNISGLPYSQPVVHMDMAERYKMWQADISRSHNLLAFLGIAGLLLFGLAGLVG